VQMAFLLRVNLEIESWSESLSMVLERSRNSPFSFSGLIFLFLSVTFLVVLFFSLIKLLRLES